MPLDVVMEAEMWAAPPRVAATVVFDPSALLVGLVPGLCSWDTLRERCVVEAGRALEVRAADPAGLNAQRLADAMAARIRSRWGTFATDPQAPGRSSLLLCPVGASLAEWDLGDRIAAPHPLVLRLRTDEIAAALRASGPDAFRRYVDVAVLQTGFRELLVTANLPSDREGAVLGVRLRKPATVDRPMPIDEFVRFTPPRDRETVVLRLSPSEDIDVEVVPVALLRTSAGDPVWTEGSPRPSADRFLVVGPTDFPVRFVPLAAAPALLAQATLTGSVRWEGPDGPGESPFRLDAGQPSRSLVLPREATAGPVSVLASDGRRSAELLLPEPPGSAIGRYSFPYYGANAVTVSCRFLRSSVIPVEFLPEEAEDRPDLRTLLLVHPQAPPVTYRWFSGSVFRTGYRFRVLSAGGEPEPWSDVQPPDRPLELVLEEAPT